MNPPPFPELREAAKAVIAADERDARESSDDSARAYATAAEYFRNYVDAGTVLRILARLDAAEKVVGACKDEIHSRLGGGIGLRSHIYDALQAYDRAITDDDKGGE